jgi:prepilin peptidase CpaA
LTSVATDLWRQRIFDAVTIPTVAVALGIRVLLEGLGGLESGLLSGGLGSLLGAAPFGLVALRKKMGWGDVKLMAAVGATMGFPAVLAALVFISIAGACQAFVMLFWNRTLRTGTAPSPIPYALAIAAGSFWAMGWWQHSKLGIVGQ